MPFATRYFYDQTDSMANKLNSCTPIYRVRRFTQSQMKTALTTIADKQCAYRKNEPIRLTLFDTSQKLSEFLSRFALNVAA